MGLLDGLSREAIYISSIARTLWKLRDVKPDSPHTISDIVEHYAAARPANLAVLYQDRTLTYAQLGAEANRVARWAIDRGVKKGDNPRCDVIFLCKLYG